MRLATMLTSREKKKFTSDLHLSYASFFWVQDSSSVNNTTYYTEKKSHRLMFFQNRNAHTGPFFKNSKT